MRPAAKAVDEPVAFGKYQLVERLGKGGMAEVWKARIVGPAGFERTMVIKRILPQLVEDPDFVAMFVSEARLSARLNHANIVTVFELAKFGDEYYLAMEYVRGHDLISVLRTHAPRGAIPPGAAAYVLREVCRALGYAHAVTDDDGNPLRIIHRDVSPSNVMIGFDGGVKLLDFGIAKALAETDDSKTLTGTLKGKLGYMSPEQLDGREIDHRADLFSIGVLLWELVTGRRLFKGATDVQTIARVREAQVAPPSTVNPEVPPELDAICLKALARDPDRRYQTGEELAAALDRVAHELAWGPERMMTLMRSLFPSEASHTKTRVPRPQASEFEDEYVQYSAAPKPRRTAVWLFAVGAVLAAAGGVAWWRLHVNTAANAATTSGAVAGTNSGGAASPITVQPLPADEAKRVQQAPAATGETAGAKNEAPAAAKSDALAVPAAAEPVAATGSAHAHGSHHANAAAQKNAAAENAATQKNAAAENAATQKNSTPAPLKAEAPKAEPAKVEPAKAEPAKPKARENLLKGDFVDPFSEGK